MKDMRAKGNNKRVLLVSGIFPPDVGGPATHVQHIAEHFSSQHWKVTVVAFGDQKSAETNYHVIRIPRRIGKIASWLRYGWTIMSESLRHDVIYAFDLTTAGLPAAFFSRLFNKPFLLRIGGDPIWERVVEKGKRFLPMRTYYEQGLYRKDKPILFYLIRFVVQSASYVVTYCNFIKDVYVHFYGLPDHRIRIIPNPFPLQQIGESENDTFTFIFAGRFVAYKNLESVVRVFCELYTTHPHARLVLIGSGPEEARIHAAATGCASAIAIHPPLMQQELFTVMKKASVALAPALTEFNPNFILEALALGKPALISQDNGLSVTVPNEWQFDPMDTGSLKEAMERMLDPVHYKTALTQLAHLPMRVSWSDVEVQHAEIVNSL